MHKRCAADPVWWGNNGSSSSKSQTHGKLDANRPPSDRQETNGVDDFGWTLRRDSRHLHQFGGDYHVIPGDGVTPGEKHGHQKSSEEEASQKSSQEGSEEASQEGRKKDGEESRQEAREESGEEGSQEGASSIGQLSTWVTAVSFTAVRARTAGFSSAGAWNEALQKMLYS
jgi:flagellar biosynthesis/type III secretory pathway protein FliH